MPLSDKVRRLLFIEKMSQSQLADDLGVSKTAVANWLNGSTKPGLDYALQIARRFSVSLDWLADDEQSGPPPIEIEWNVPFPPIDRSAASLDKEVIWEMVQTIGVMEAKKRLMGLAPAPESGTKRGSDS